LNPANATRNLQPGTFVFVHLAYDDDSQRPSAFIYGIVRDGQLEYREFDNR